MSINKLVVYTLFLFLSVLLTNSYAENLDDSVALNGIKTAKSVFLIGLSEVRQPKTITY